MRYAKYQTLIRAYYLGGTHWLLKAESDITLEFDVSTWRKVYWYNLSVFAFSGRGILGEGGHTGEGGGILQNERIHCQLYYELKSMINAAVINNCDPLREER